MEQKSKSEVDYPTMYVIEYRWLDDDRWEPNCSIIYADKERADKVCAVLNRGHGRHWRVAIHLLKGDVRERATGKSVG